MNVRDDQKGGLSGGQPQQTPNAEPDDPRARSPWIVYRPIIGGAALGLGTLILGYSIAGWICLATPNVGSATLGLMFVIQGAVILAGRKVW